GQTPAAHQLRRRARGRPARGRITRAPSRRTGSLDRERGRQSPLGVKRGISIESFRNWEIGDWPNLSISRSPIATLLFLVGGGQNLAAVILAAIRANPMGALHLAAIRAGDEMIEAQGVVRAALVAPGLGNFSLGNCTHDMSSL